MNNKLKLMYGFLILVVIFTTKIIHAQENKYNKNQFTYFDSSYEFFDGSKTMDIEAYNRDFKRNGYYTILDPLRLKGYAYQRRINDRSAIKLGAEFLLRHYHDIEIGGVLRRQMWNFDLSYLHTIWFFKKVELQLCSGIHYRMGGESLLALVTNTDGVS
ncbi:MAG: hypothetical protein JKY53_06550, partial [Flavobacteriales bacterium]|nr:hypothetical protein [Flavobacteriales bacterium]